MLKTWNLVVHTPIYLVSENVPFSARTVLILLMSAFFAKNQHFLVKIVPLLKAIVWELCWRFMMLQFANMFWWIFISLVRFSYWTKLGIPHLAQLFPMKCYLMLQNARGYWVIKCKKKNPCIKNSEYKSQTKKWCQF